MKRNAKPSIDHEECDPFALLKYFFRIGPKPLDVIVRMSPSQLTRKIMDLHKLHIAVVAFALVHQTLWARNRCNAMQHEVCANELVLAFGFRPKLGSGPNPFKFRKTFFNLTFAVDLVGSYGLGGEEFVAEELEDACADIPDTLEADNYEDQLPQPEVSSNALKKNLRRS